MTPPAADHTNFKAGTRDALARLRGAPWLRAPATQAVFAALATSGHEARAVGGAVRNTLMGYEVADIDIATTALPEVTMAAAQRAGLKVFTTGLQHGTVTVMSNHVPHEVTTLRQDVETDGRHARVAFTDDWAVDAARRDFTMNALYCDAAGALFDPLSGMSDLMARRVRFINDPHARIEEDYLRILRFFRFNAQYGSGDGGDGSSSEAANAWAALDQPGLSACIAARAGLSQLSAERIHVEILKLLAAPGALAMMRVMSAAGLLVQILGAAPRLANLRRLVLLQEQLALPADPVLRLAVSAIAVRDDVARITRRLRLSRDEKKVLAYAGGLDAPAAIIALRPELTGHDYKGAKRLLYRWGRDSYQTRVLLHWANRGALDRAHEGYAKWRALYDLPKRWDAPQLPVSGGDLVAMGLPAGPKVGVCLNAFEAWWIDAGFPTAPADFELQLAQLVAEYRDAQ